jgi:hypothetical protein
MLQLFQSVFHKPVEQLQKLSLLQALRVQHSG